MKIFKFLYWLPCVLGMMIYSQMATATFMAGHQTVLMSTATHWEILPRSVFIRSKRNTGTCGTYDKGKGSASTYCNGLWPKHTMGFSMELKIQNTATGQICAYTGAISCSSGGFIIPIVRNCHAASWSGFNTASCNKLFTWRVMQGSDTRYVLFNIYPK